MNPASQRATRKAATRSAVIACADRLFRAQGYEASSLREIARICAISTGAIFASFTGKAELLDAVLAAAHPADPARRAVFALTIFGRPDEAAAVRRLIGSHTPPRDRP